MELKVQIKQAGSRSSKITSATLLLSEVPQTVGELISFAAKSTYYTFKTKSELTEAFQKGNLSSVIIYPEQSIADMAASGKIAFDFPLQNEKITEQNAVNTALEAFDDGLIALFIDDQRFENKNQPLTLTGNETITFIKLTMLAGRMW